MARASVTSHARLAARLAALALALLGGIAGAQSIRDANIVAGRVRSDLPAGSGTATQWLSLGYLQSGAEGCLWNSADSFSGCPGRAGLPDRPGGIPVWGGTLQRFTACGGSTTRIGDSWQGCLAYDNDNYFALNNPASAYWVIVANDDPGFDQCNEGPPGSSHRVASANAWPRTMFKLDVASGTDAGKHLRLGVDLGDKDFFCARTGAYEYSIPFLSVGTQNGRGNAGPVGTVNRRGSPRGTIVFDAAISHRSALGCAPGTQTPNVCIPSRVGLHAGVYAYATWGGIARLLFVDLYDDGILAGGGPPGRSRWNWPVHDSFQFPGAEVLVTTAGDSLHTYCGIDIPALDPQGARVRYEIDFGRILACLDARGLTTQPMPAGDIALDGVHWFIEGAATLGALGLDISRVETAIFVDGFD